MGDLYELELQALTGVRGWNVPETKGAGPCARESHAAVAYAGLGSSKLFIFGGMQGCRLNDFWQLDLCGPFFILLRSLDLIFGLSADVFVFLFFFFFLCLSGSMVWSAPETRGPAPLPRSLHSASLIGNKYSLHG